MQVAESKGLPKLKYHLLPRTKGFWVTVQSLRGTGECLFVFVFKCGHPISFMGRGGGFANQMKGGAD